MSTHRPSGESSTVSRDFALSGVVAFVAGMTFLFVRLQTESANGGLHNDPLSVLGVPILFAAACLSVKWAATIANPLVRIAGLIAASLAFVLSTTFLLALLFG
jgi:hypothetical protein